MNSREPCYVPQRRHVLLPSIGVALELCAWEPCGHVGKDGESLCKPSSGSGDLAEDTSPSLSNRYVFVVLVCHAQTVYDVHDCFPEHSAGMINTESDDIVRDSELPLDMCAEVVRILEKFL